MPKKELNLSQLAHGKCRVQKARDNDGIASLLLVKNNFLIPHKYWRGYLSPPG